MACQHCAGVGASAQDKALDAPVPTVGAHESIDVGLLLRWAINTRGYALEFAGERMGYRPDFFSRVLDGERGCVLARLGKLPKAIQRELVNSWAGALGMRPPEDVAKLDQVASLLASGKVRVILEGVKS